MNLTPKQYQVLYAISMLKAPLSSSIWVLCGAERKETQHRLRALTDKGLIDPKPYGTQRLMYMLSLAGQSVLASYLASNPAPELAPQGAPKQARVRRKVEPKVYEEGMALPRCIPIPKESYEPLKDNSYYRNNGNKHVRSLGAFQ